MRIAMLNASVSRTAGGIFEVERRLSQELSGYPDVSVGVFGVQDEFTESDLSQWLPLRPQTFASRGPKSFGYCPQLLSALEAWEADLTHLHSLWMYPSLVLQRWSAKSRRPAMITPHGMLDSWALSNSRWKKQWALGLFERQNLESARCIHVLNASEAASVRALGLANPIAVVPNAVDLPQQMETSDTQLAPWAQGRKVLLYLGRIHPKKGLATLVRAWEQRHAAGVGTEWMLVIAGWDQGRHEDEIKGLATSLGIPWVDTRLPDTGTSLERAAIVFAGPRFGVEKEAMYGSSEAFILPSVSEGLPMTVLEAWAYGKPVLMTSMCNLPEGFESGAALQIEPEMGSISNGIRELVALSDEKRKHMGALGRQLVETRFSWPKAAAQMKGVYDWVLGGGQKPECILS